MNLSHSMKTLVLAAAVIVASTSATARQTLPPSLSEYVYAVPNGWVPTVSPDGILLRATVLSTGENCLIGLSQIVPSTGDLFADANMAWARSLAGFDVRPTMTFPADPHIIRGIAAQGWEYLIVKRGVGLRGAPVDPLRDRQFFGFVMVAKLGGQVATVFGVSLDPLVSSCFGSSLGNVWPQFFSSLQFRNFAPTAVSTLAQKIVGVWESYGSSIGGAASLQYVFTPAGRYAESGATRRYVGNDQVLTSTTFGDGAYVLRGSQITLMPDRGQPEVGSVRLEQVSEDGGTTWVEKLYLVKPNPTAGRCGQFNCGPPQLEFQMTRVNQ
jgi:hypothetical protein